MKIEREELLTQLQLVQSGLSSREVIEQSSCFVFEGGWVKTFNDEVACRIRTEVTFEGAVQAKLLLMTLERLKDKFLRVRVNDDGELEFLGKNKNFAVVRDAEIFLPIDRVEKPPKDTWTRVPEGLIEALRLVGGCVSSDESRFMLTCVHLHPDYVEACDNLQIMRCRIKTGLKESVLVRGSSLKDLVQLGATKMAQTKTWMHFRNAKGLIFSCRQYAEKYPCLDELIQLEAGKAISLPKRVAEATDMAEVYASDRAGEPLVSVRLTNGMMKVSGRGLAGWYREVTKVVYQGPKLVFFIAPHLLRHVCENYASAQITDGKLKAVSASTGDTLPWEYITVLAPPETEDTAQPEETQEGDDEGEGENEDTE